MRAWVDADTSTQMPFDKTDMLKKEKGLTPAKLSNSKNLVHEDLYTSLIGALGKISDMDKVERDIKFLGTLITASACLPNYNYIYLGKYISPHLHLFIEGDSGSGKSLAINCTQLLKDIQEELNKENERLQMEWLSLEAKERSLKSECQYLTIKAAANSTASSLYKMFADNPNNGLLMQASEADSLLDTMGKEHGTHISTLIRQASEHEVLEKTLRTNNFRADVNFPKLAILLTGTPDQRAKITENNGGVNGLANRFMYYQINEFRQFTTGLYGQDLDTTSIHFENDMFNKWQLLNRRKGNPLQYKTNNELFLDAEKWNWDIRIPLEKQNTDFRVICARLQKEFFRTMMVLRVLDASPEELEGEFLEATEKELYQAKHIFKVIYKHSLAIHEKFISHTHNKKKVSKQDILIKLSNIFRYTHFTKLAICEGVEKRTAEKWIALLAKQELIAKRNDGLYEKTQLQLTTWEGKLTTTEKPN